MKRKHKKDIDLSKPGGYAAVCDMFREAAKKYGHEQPKVEAAINCFGEDVVGKTLVRYQRSQLDPAGLTLPVPEFLPAPSLDYFIWILSSQVMEDFNGSKFIPGNLEFDSSYIPMEDAKMVFADMFVPYVHACLEVGKPCDIEEAGQHVIRKGLEEYAVSIISMAGARQLVENHHPIFQVSQDLMDTLDLTDLPEVIQDGDIRVPFPALHLLFPKNSLRLILEKGGPEYYMEAITLTTVRNDNAIDLCASVTTTHAPDDNRILRVSGMVTFENGSHQIVVPASYDEGTQGFGTLREAITAILKILYALAAEPEIMEPAVDRWEKKIGDKVAKRVRRPPTLTMRSYYAKRGIEPVSTHARPCAHIRRGHLRQQPYGPNNSLRKSKWIHHHWVCRTNELDSTGEPADVEEP